MISLIFTLLSGICFATTTEIDTNEDFRQLDRSKQGETIYGTRAPNSMDMGNSWVKYSNGVNGSLTSFSRHPVTGAWRAQGDGNVYAKSVDGARRVEGCAVVVKFPDGGGANDEMVFTSTTTADGGTIAADVRMGVLLEECAPGAKCLVGLNGVYRVCIGDSIGTDDGIDFSATRCCVGAAVLNGSADFARKMQVGAQGSGNVWIKPR